MDLLIAMGYGGTFGKALHTQLSNDGGIDDVIDQDALGLSRIYVQAKRYDPRQTIGRPAIQGFVGALQGVQANQGVFLTTATFTKSAKEYAEGVQSRVVLIDGERAHPAHDSLRCRRAGEEHSESSRDRRGLL